MKKLICIITILLSFILFMGFTLICSQKVDEFYDFVGKNIDLDVWSHDTIGVGSSVFIDTSKHYGEVVLEGDVSGAAMALVSGTGISYMINVEDNFELSFRAKVGKNYNHPALGLSHDVNNLILFYFSYDSNWRTLTRVEGSSTDIESNISIDANYHVFKIVGTSVFVKFYIDNDLVATHTTNIPTSDMFIQVRLDLLEAGQDYMYCDWIRFVADR